MSSMNYVILVGGLTRDPELRHTGGGMAIAKFSLAVSEKFKDKTGKETESICYIDVDAWGNLGENCTKYLKKGSQALVQGKLQLEQWDGKDGTKRSKISLRASDVQFLSRSNPEALDPDVGQRERVRLPPDEETDTDFTTF